MIVVDASVIGPLVLLDEQPLPAKVIELLETEPLIAPAHWPIETGNMLAIARRRGRIDAIAWETAFTTLRALRVRVTMPADFGGVREMADLVADHGLTIYDAAYLNMALVSGASIASLDQDLLDSARRVDVEVVTRS